MAVVAQPEAVAERAPMAAQCAASLAVNAAAVSPREQGAMIFPVLGVEPPMLSVLGAEPVSRRSAP